MITRPFSTATPDSAMKPTPALIESGMPRSTSAATPPVSASGTPLNTSARVADRAEAHEQQHEDQQQRDRHDDGQALRRRDELLELAAPADPVAGRQLDLRRRSARCASATKEPRSRPRTLARDHDAALAVLAADLVRPRRDLDLGDGRQRHVARPARAASCPGRAHGAAGWPRRRQRDRQRARARRCRRAGARAGARTRSKRRSPSNTRPALLPPTAISTTSCTSATLRP